MSVLSAGLLTLLNGLLALVGAIISPVALAVLVLGVGFLWLARLEIDQLNRQATKPEIGRH